MKSTIKVLMLAVFVCMFTFCNGKANKKTNNEILKGEQWLKSVFTCADDENAFCFPDEESICTERYYSYYTEYMEIFEYPNFETEVEQKTAELKFEEKWKNIYPLGIEIWTPFGRGNGMEIGQKLKNVSIAHIEGLIYLVTVDYGDGLVFKNEVTLVSYNDVFQIDYFKTEQLE